MAHPKRFRSTQSPIRRYSYNVVDTQHQIVPGIPFVIKTNLTQQDASIEADRLNRKDDGATQRKK